MLQKEFFQVQPFNPNPYWDPVILNLSGAQKFEQNTIFKPGRYRIEVAPGSTVGATRTMVSNMNHIEEIRTPFIIRAYCGGNATNQQPGVNLYTGEFKVNGQVNSPKQNGIDVNHIFGAGGGNGNLYAMYIGDSFLPGGPNSLGNGYSITSGLFSPSYGGAGSCLHLIPVGGTFGTNYIRAYHAAPTGGCPGSAYGGAAGGCRTDVGGGYSWAYRGGNSPYGNGGAAVIAMYPSQGTGIGAGGKKIHATIDGITADFVIGAGAYFNGTTWVDEPGKLTNTGSSYIRITFLGPLE